MYNKLHTNTNMKEKQKLENLLLLMEARLPRSQRHVLEHHAKKSSSSSSRETTTTREEEEEEEEKGEEEEEATARARAKVYAQLEGSLGDDLEYFCDAFHRAMKVSKKGPWEPKKKKKKESNDEEEEEEDQKEEDASAAERKKRTRIEPIVPDVVAAEASEEERKAWREEGYALIRAGKVGAIVMAGGQGTRLGSALPKGTFDIGLPSKKSLFQLQAERIRKVIELATDAAKAVTGANKGTESALMPSLPWYIMTSPQTHEQTVDFFRENAYFNLPEKDVVFFQQQEAPVFDLEGKIILAPDGSIQTAPDGNGSIYRALLKSNALADMKKRGVRHLHCYSVDNALILPGDCEFIGYCALRGKQSGAKVIKKISPDEKVGVFVREVSYSNSGDGDDDDDACDRGEVETDAVRRKSPSLPSSSSSSSSSSSRIRVLEYSEIEPSMRDEREEVDYDEFLPDNMRTGDSDDPSSFVKIQKYNRPPWDHFNPDNRPLRFRCANIAIHYFSLDFLYKVAEIANARSCSDKDMVNDDGNLDSFAMEYHVAEKDVPCYVESETEERRTKKAIKLESFIFDAYQFSSDGVTIFEGERKHDFAPVKQATGDDSPESARRMISFLHSTWISKNRGRIQWGGYGGLVEVSPLVSLRGENLELVNDCDVQRNTSIELGWEPPTERQTPWHRYYGKHSSLP